MILACWMKWLLSGAATVGAIAGLLLAGILAIVLSIAVLFVAGMGVAYLWRRFVPQVIEARRVAFLDRMRDTSESSWFLWSVIACAVSVFVWIATLAMMQGIFGCNECLPEAMRQKCEATLTELEAKDREDFERICSAHPGWCK